MLFFFRPAHSILAQLPGPLAHCRCLWTLPAHRRLMRSPWLPSSSRRSSRQKKKKRRRRVPSPRPTLPGPHRLLRPAAVVTLHAACVRLRHGRRRLALAVHGPAVSPAAVAPPPLAGPPMPVSHASASSPGIA